VIRKVKIPIKGIIAANDEKMIYEWFGYEVTTPKDVNQLINKANGEDLEVEINSPGGDVFSGSEIYTNLKNYKEGKVEVNIVGVAASAGSVIAMAGEVTRISPTAQIMIHNVSSVARGDYRALENQSKMLKNYNKSIANAYILKSGMEMDELLKLMNTGGTANTGAWLTAQQAKEYGLVDEIMFDTGNKLVASAAGSLTLPPSVIDKMRNHLKSDEEENSNQEGLENNQDTSSQSKGLEKYKARLKLLRLKGEII